MKNNFAENNFNEGSGRRTRNPEFSLEVAAPGGPHQEINNEHA
jgi:hypothetical protein